MWAAAAAWSVAPSCAVPSFARNEGKATLPPVPLTKRNVKSKSLMVMAMTFVLVILTGMMGFYVVTNTGVPRVSRATNPAFPTYIIRPKKGSFALYDSLREENKNLGWLLPPGICNFTGGALHVKITRISTTLEHFHNCMTSTPLFTNFAYEVKMTFITSNPDDCGGASFRNDVVTEMYLYYFYICRDGHYGLVRYLGDNAPINYVVLVENSYLPITKYSGQTYTIGVVAQGFKFDVYVNQEYLTSVLDTNNGYSAGTIGVIVRTLGIGTTEVAFSDATVWIL